MISQEADQEGRKEPEFWADCAPKWGLRERVPLKDAALILEQAHLGSKPASTLKGPWFSHLCNEETHITVKILQRVWGHQGFFCLINDGLCLLPTAPKTVSTSQAVLASQGDTPVQVLHLLPLLLFLILLQGSTPEIWALKAGLEEDQPNWSAWPGLHQTLAGPNLHCD